eukprot:CAMPEP_0119346650 /NCGR_PEP_ID=MMETSP1333-20130426/108114_1 /TAXON_ID=418940 /ORGANISM="Scyphosphaera apsteinii, Strain RCC1455" /LENGTH=526 /DNA_ID=CAMNT_0007359161 /DNA_START=180 /DNA_END=1760 /DNA_ORIENTATION=-
MVSSFPTKHEVGDVCEHVKGLCWNAAWHAANARAGRDCEAKRTLDVFHEHANSLLQLLQEDLACSIKWLSWNAAWRAANERKGYWADAANARLACEEHGDFMARRLPAELAESIRNSASQASWHASNSLLGDPADAEHDLRAYHESVESIAQKINRFPVLRISESSLQYLEHKGRRDGGDVVATGSRVRTMHPFWYNAEQRTAYDGEVIGHSFQLGDSGVAVLIHRVRYDDGYTGWVNLPQHHFTLLEGPYLAPALSWGRSKLTRCSFEYIFCKPRLCGSKKLVYVPEGCESLLQVIPAGRNHSEVIRKRISGWEAICSDELPAMPHSQLFEGPATRSNYHLLLTTVKGHKTGRVLAGTTFRLIQACHRDGWSLTIVYVLALAVGEKQQRCGCGTLLVEALKAIGLDLGSERDAASVLLTQADLYALAFWRQQGMHSTSEASRLLTGLYQWREAENQIFQGAVPMLVELSGLTGEATVTPDLSNDPPEQEEVPGKRRRVKVDYKRVIEGCARSVETAGTPTFTAAR